MGGNAALAITGQNPDERRCCGRYTVEWPAEIDLGKATATGVVRDLGDRGAFVDLSSVHRWTRRLDLDQLISVGDLLYVSYTLRPFARSVRRLVTLRWIGRHPTQGCYGLGIQFEPEP